MIPQSTIQKILAAIETQRGQFVGSDKQFAVKLGISNSQYSNITHGNTAQQLSDAKWIRLARELGVHASWRCAKKPQTAHCSATLATSARPTPHSITPAPTKMWCMWIAAK